MEVGKLSHSQSQPGGMNYTPPGTPKKSGKMLSVRVQMLDDTITIFQVQAKALGRILFEQVCSQLHLLESDYFGLEYQEIGGTKYWLDLEKPLSRQIGLSIDSIVRFCVKFYTPDPSQLEEEFTRYLFCLQIKRDLSQGLLQCNNNTAALLASYLVQAECGDYVVEDYPDHRYLSSYKFVPNQDHELERRIMENHKKHSGQSPAEADLNLLETARRCELYGIKMHAAKDHEGVPLNLAVAHMGIVVFQNFTKINTFSWAKIRKISFKRKRFLVKLHPEGYGYYKDTVEFFFEGRNECKNFWKKCVENHGFFRCSIVKKVPRQKTRVLSRGSSFRYSGRTQKQIVDFVRENYVKRQTFQRSQSFRHSSSAHSSVANVGTSISAHPLLPLGENAVAGTPASLSCGSMTLTSSPLHAADIHVGVSPSPPLVAPVSSGTSATSSPQHLYPQEIPCRQTDHRLAKVKHPQERSHHGISLPQSPTGAATTVSSHSANRFSDNNNNDDNNNEDFDYDDENKVIIDGSDVKSCHIILRSLDRTNFNEIYSNGYGSLKSLRNNVHSNEAEFSETKIDILDSNNYYSGRAGNVASHFGKRSRETGYNERYRSLSCKDLYLDDSPSHKKRIGDDLEVTSKTYFENEENQPVDYEVSLNERGRTEGKCPTALTDRHPPFGSGMKIYSGSYPGPMSAYSAESVNGKPENPGEESTDTRYDSHDEMALSHDDVSHDSYELLEKEFDGFQSKMSRNKGRKIYIEGDKTGLCSWEVDKSLRSLNFRSTENVVIKDNDVWSFEKARSSIHGSETDFRSLDRRSLKGSNVCARNRAFDFEDRMRISRRLPTDMQYDFVYGHSKSENQSSYGYLGILGENEVPVDEIQLRSVRSQDIGGQCLRSCHGGLWSSRGEKNFDEEKAGITERLKHPICRKSAEKYEAFLPNMNSEEEVMRFEEKRKLERKRDKKNKEDRFHEGFKEKEHRDWEREKEKRQNERKKDYVDLQIFSGEESTRKTRSTPGDYSNFQEIHFKKFDRVVSNQFGKYSEFLKRESMTEEGEVAKDYEKVCQMNKTEKKESNGLAYEVLIDEERGNTRGTISGEQITEFIQAYPPDRLLKENDAAFAQIPISKGNGFTRFAKTLVERTKSDPYNSSKQQKKNVLMHQKSIDLSCQKSEETNSELDIGGSFKKTSRSEHDIPYVLHKRHRMNGTARNVDFAFPQTDVKVLVCNKSKKTFRKEGHTLDKADEKEKKQLSKHILIGTKSKEHIKSDFWVGGRKSERALVNISDSSECADDLHAVGPVPKTIAAEAKVEPVKNSEMREKSVELAKPRFVRDLNKCQKIVKIEEKSSELHRDEPAPEFPEPILSLGFDENRVSTRLCEEILPEVLPHEGQNVGVSAKRNKGTNSEIGSSAANYDESGKAPTNPVRSKLPCSLGSSIHQRREESFILFARTRLGLSESSAMIQTSRQKTLTFPAAQRRTKSLDAPYVSVHHLPPADAFSSMDDTVDSNDCDSVISFKKQDKRQTDNDLNVFLTDKSVGSFEDSMEAEEADLVTKTESEAEKFSFHDFGAGDSSERSHKSEERVGEVTPDVKIKELLPKTGSPDGIDSEGDMDSSKQTDTLPIPSDRLVNLPEFVRFPSVRQMSGQTSEESADGWDQNEVRVKRRAPRRSLGRDEPDPILRDPVLLVNKDDEPRSYEDDVWDDNVVFSANSESSAVLDMGTLVEYLKRGSCGQSIDDDNLSTPMKESSPEHWVSVEDLPEAVEKEEKFLLHREKMLQAKILNEKLKRELNLDTVVVGENNREYNDGSEQAYLRDCANFKDTFKGHSLDTYELAEKKLREKGANKFYSLDEHLLRIKPSKSEIEASKLRGKDCQKSDELLEHESLKTFPSLKDLDYVKCKVVNNVIEIDQYEDDNDEELEEFFVVLDENADRGDVRDIIWENSVALRSLSKEESIISVPDEFKDDDGDKHRSTDKIQILLSEIEIESPNGASGEGGKKVFQSGPAQEKTSVENISPQAILEGDVEKLLPLDTTQKKSSICDDVDCLSPLELSSTKVFDYSRRHSVAEDVGRLSPFSDSRRNSEEPRRPSTSEESRKYSNSESVSEETRRRLSSTEETRRKRASLTKQCSVGADSLTDELISGIQECSSSFEHDDEKDVFERESPGFKTAENIEPTPAESADVDSSNGLRSAERVHALEIEVFEDTPKPSDLLSAENEEIIPEANVKIYLIPPANKRELSGETEDSIDYCEEDFRDLHDAVKDKDISEDLNCEQDSSKSADANSKMPLAPEKSEVFASDGLRYIDEKRGSTPEIIVGKNKKDVSVSVIVVNEGLAVLSKIVGKENDTLLREFNENVCSPGVVDSREGLTPRTSFDVERHTLPKIIPRGKSICSGNARNTRKKFRKTLSLSGIPLNSLGSAGENLSQEKAHKSNFDSSVESDTDKLSEISILSYVQSLIARRNLVDAGKGLRQDEFDLTGKRDSLLEQVSDRVTASGEALSRPMKTPEKLEKTNKLLMEKILTPAGEPTHDNGKAKGAKNMSFVRSKMRMESGGKSDCSGVDAAKEKKSPDLEKRDSGEEGSSSSSAPLHPRRELSSTWKPFLLESSGSSSLEEGWLPPDDNAHLADEEETSSNSNNQQDDSSQDNLEYPNSLSHPMLKVPAAEMMVGGFSNVYVLSRTLSRISERSTSEQERSDLEEDFTKLTSHSTSTEEESMISSDHPPSLSSDPPSPRSSTCRIPDLPDDKPLMSETLFVPGDNKTECEPFRGDIPPPLEEDDWPSPPSTSSIFDPPVLSHIETVYLEIFPEEACKVVVAEGYNEENSHSDDNPNTLHEECEYFPLSSDNVSVSTTTTTQDGTVVIPLRRQSVRANSASEDSSVISASEWSGSAAATKIQSNSNCTAPEVIGSDFGDRIINVAFKGSKSGRRTEEDRSRTDCERDLPASGFIASASASGSPSFPSKNQFDSQASKMTSKVKPPKLLSPTGKMMGFFETPISKVHGPASQGQFFEYDGRHAGSSTLKIGVPQPENPFSRSNNAKFSDNQRRTGQISETCDHRSGKGHFKGNIHDRKQTKNRVRGSCTSYYYNAADCAEKSYFGRYDTGSLERKKIHSSRKCLSYYSVSRTAPDEDDSSKSDDIPAPISNTIPRASKKTRKRHRVAMDLEICDGRIVAPPTMRATVLENSDSDRSSPGNLVSKGDKKTNQSLL